MCAASVIMDHYGGKWEGLLGRVYGPLPVSPSPIISPISAEEINEFRALLEKAREYDRVNREPDCELEEKRDKLRKLADELGVIIDFV